MWAQWNNNIQKENLIVEMKLYETQRNFDIILTYILKKRGNSEIFTERDWVYIC
jgi:predicted CopG family antitoxin